MPNGFSPDPPNKTTFAFALSRKVSRDEWVFGEVEQSCWDAGVSSHDCQMEKRGIFVDLRDNTTTLILGQARMNVRRGTSGGDGIPGSIAGRC